MKSNNPYLNLIARSNFYDKLRIEAATLTECNDKMYAELSQEQRDIQVIVMSWGMGLGKTTEINKMLKENRNWQYFLVIVHRVILAVELSLKLHVKCYIQYDESGNRISNKFFDYRNMTICINSLKLVQHPIDWLIIDEVEGVLNNIASETLFKNSIQAQDIYLALLHMLKHATKIILSDANVGTLTLFVLEQAGRLDGALLSTSIRRDVDLIYIGSHKRHFQFILSEIKRAKKIAVACMSKAKAHELRDLIVKLIPDCELLCITRDTKGIDQFLMMPGDEKYRADVTIYSPIIDAGVSIELTDWFDCIHIVCSNVGDSSSFMQMMARVRSPKTNKVYFSGRVIRQFRPLKNVDNTMASIKYKSEMLDVLSSFGNPNSEYPPLEIDERFLQFLLMAEESKYRRGNGYVCEWIIDNCPTQDWSDMDFEVMDFNASYVSEQLIKNKDEYELKRAQFISKKSLDEYESLLCLSRVRRLTLDEQYTIEYGRLCERFGAAFEKASLNDQIAIARADEYKHLTQQAELFALVLSPASVCYYVDKKEAMELAPPHHKTLGVRANLLRQIFSGMGINLSTDVSDYPCFWSSSISFVQEFCCQNYPTFNLQNIPVPNSRNAESAIRWIKKVFNLIGLRLEKQRQKRVNNIRVRPYKICSESFNRMLSLSMEIRNSLSAIKTEGQKDA